MDRIKIKLVNNNSEIFVDNDTPLYEIVKEHFTDKEREFLIANYNNEIVDLNRRVQSYGSVEFLTIEDTYGNKAYQTSALYLLITAIKENYGKDTDVLVKHSIGKNIYVEVKDRTIEMDDIEKIQNLMQVKIDKKYEIEKIALSLTRANEVCEQSYVEDKKDVLKYRRGSTVNMYKLDWFYNYFYGALVLDLTKLTKFKISYVEPNLVLQIPNQHNINELNVIKDIPKIQNVFEEAKEWASVLNIETVGKLNNKIVENKFNEVIRLNEELHEKKLSNIADAIKSQNKKLVLIAGPSSSGKTTFANRISDHLRVIGLKPHIISLDDYYLDREEIPYDENGKQNFEVIDALDIAMINRDIKRILDGEVVEIPSFNFKAGKKEYLGKTIQLKEDDIIVMEGIHGLNELLTKEISKDDKFKIFISALTTLNIDNHNRIATTDTRLIRRLVRDFNTRGFSAISTIAMWPTVLAGEVMNIFPYQNEADAVFNSALIYELSVLKQYVEPLLFSITPEQPEYKDARRLVKFLENFLVPHGLEIPKTSIVREFVGGGCFIH